MVEVGVIGESYGGRNSLCIFGIAEAYRHECGGQKGRKVKEGEQVLK